MKWQARSTAIAPLLLALASFGCGSDETRPAAPSATAPAPAQPTEEATPEAAAEPAAPAVQGEVMEWSGSLPSDFPPDVPQYPGSKVASAQGTQDLGVGVTFDSPDSLDQVTKFYADTLASMGWQTQTQVVEEGSMILGDKEGKALQALVHPGGQGTLIDIVIAPTQ